MPLCNKLQVVKQWTSEKFKTSSHLRHQPAGIMFSGCSPGHNVTRKHKFHTNTTCQIQFFTARGAPAFFLLKLVPCFILQDTYDITEDDEPEEHEHHSHDASSDNFYDAPAASKDGTGLPEVRIDLSSASDDPQDRLIAAIAALREVIVDNTNMQRTGKRRRGQERSGAGGSGPQSRSNGPLKDERLKVRKEKVRPMWFYICRWVPVNPNMDNLNSRIYNSKSYRNLIPISTTVLICQLNLNSSYISKRK